MVAMRWLALALACSALLLPATSVSARTVPVQIIEQHGAVSAKLMESALIAYSLELPDLDLTGSMTDISTATTALYSTPPTVDFIVMSQTLTAVYDSTTNALVKANTDISSFPIGASAIVPIYKLAGTTFATIPVLLSRSALAKIFRGNITKWNDPVLVALNPLLTMPNKGIIMILPAGKTMQALALSQALVKFDSTWATDIGAASDTVNWPLAKYSSYVLTSGSLASTVLSTAYSFSFSAISNAGPLGLQQASMINLANMVVVCGTDSINYAFLELGSVTDATTGAVSWGTDLTDGSGYEAWPITFPIAVYIPLTASRTTCLARTAVVAFWLWFLGSTVVSDIATNLGISILPALLYTALGVDDFLRKSVTCEGEAVAATVTNSILVAGASLATIYSDVDSSYLGYYGATDADYSYSFTISSELQAVQQLAATEISAAIILPTQFMFINPGVMEANIFIEADYAAGKTTGDLAMFPYSVYAVVPMHNLPPGVKTAYTNWPLVLDLQTLALIYTASISKWTDPAIEAFNPGLTAAFTSSGSSTNITLVFCCGSGVVAPVTNALVSAMNATSATFQSFMTWTMPPTWTTVITAATAAGMPTVQVTTEKQLESAVERISGAIGYKLAYGDTDITTDFALQKVTAPGTLRATASTSGAVTTILEPSVDTLRSCGLAVTPSLDLDYQLRNIIPQTVGTGTDAEVAASAASVETLSGCWPVTLMSALAVQSSYSGTTACAAGNRTLGLVSWLLTDTTLDASSNDRSILRLSQLQGMSTLQTSVLNALTCDGETLLITLPTVWVLNPAVTSFAWALAALGLISVAISLGLLIVYRHRSVLRSSSVPFQVVILGGLTVMFVALGVFGMAPSTGGCQSLAWLLNIGFTLMFGPLFAKMWRIYKIFDGRVLKVVKITNERLGAMVAVLVAKDIIINLTWQLYSPVYAAPTLVLQNSKYWSYTQCTGDKGSLPFLLLILCLKFLLLVFGSFMGFTTRNVASTFNESKNVAWAIYNVFFSVAIIVPILMFSAARGDSFTILIVFLLFWISACTLGLNFGSKFIVLFRSEEAAAAAADSAASQDQSVAANSQLFSFPALASLPKHILDRYIGALETQMYAAKTRHKQLLEDGATGGTALSRRSRSHHSKGASRGGGEGGGSGLHPAKKHSRLNGSRGDGQGSGFGFGLRDRNASEMGQLQSGMGREPMASVADSYRVTEDDVSVRAGSPTDMMRGGRYNSGANTPQLASQAGPSPFARIKTLPPSPKNGSVNQSVSQPGGANRLTTAMSTPALSNQPSARSPSPNAPPVISEVNTPVPEDAEELADLLPANLLRHVSLGNSPAPLDLDASPLGGAVESARAGTQHLAVPGVTPTTPAGSDIAWGEPIDADRRLVDAAQPSSALPSKRGSDDKPVTVEKQE